MNLDYDYLVKLAAYSRLRKAAEDAEPRPMGAGLAKLDPGFRPIGPGSMKANPRKPMAPITPGPGSMSQYNSPLGQKSLFPPGFSLTRFATEQVSRLGQ